MLSNQAKSHIRRFRAWNILNLCIIVLLAVTISVLMITDIFTITQGLIACAVITAAYYFGSRFVNALIWRKHVFNILLEELNAPLFVEVVEGVQKYDPYSMFQLQKLQAEGRYADVVSLCTIQLQNPTARQLALSYLHSMESAYFHLGDDRKLKEIHEATEWQILQSKDPAKSRKKIVFHDFFGLYLKRDLDACEAFLAANPTTGRLSAMNRLLTRARMALLRGNTDEAAELFRKILTEAPNTPAAVVAKANAEAIERGEGYGKAFPEALPDPLFPVDAAVHAQKHKTVTIVRRLYNIVAIAVIAAAVLFALVMPYVGRSEDEAYNKLIQEAVEVDHDGVTVHGNFYLYEGERAVESVAVCTTDEGFLLVSLYYLENPDEVLCEPLVTLSEEAFAGNALPSGSFEGYVSDYYATYAFYAAKRDVPRGIESACPVEIGGRTLWFAVTYVGQSPNAEKV